MSRIKITRLLGLFGLVSFIGFAAVVISGLSAIHQLKVGGPLYERVILGKDLIADILPPPEYVIEPYLEATLALNDPSTVAERRQKLQKLREDYDNRHRYWEAVPGLDGALRAKLTRESHGHAARMWDEIDSRLLPALEKKDEAGARTAYTAVAAAYAAHRAVIDAIVRDAEAMNAETERVSAADERLYTGAMWTVSAIVLAVLAGGLAGAAFGVIRPLVRITAAMRRLAGGALDSPIPDTGRGDEVGDMARSLEVFRDHAREADRLQRAQETDRHRAEEEKRAALLSMADVIERESRQAVERVAQQTGGMSGAADGMAGSAERVSVNAQNVAAAAEQALGNAQMVASAAEQLTASIAEIANRIAQSSAVTRRAVDKGKEARSTIASLSEVVARIGQVAQLIQDIASQTNLLALNATIEAARAGEAGKGFAVVAGEVKNLANQTARSTEEITTLIAEIEAVTGHAVDAVGGIDGIIGEVDAVSASIAAAIEEQASATGEISRSVVETSNAAQEVSARIGHVSQEAAETGVQAASVRSGSASVAAAIEELRHVVVRVVRTSIADADRRREPRYAMAEPCMVEAGSTARPATIVNLSRHGAMIDGSGLPGTGNGVLRLDRHHVALPFAVRGRDGASVHLVFTADAPALDRFRPVFERLTQGLTPLGGAA